MNKTRASGHELSPAYETPEFKDDDEAAAWYLTHDTAKLDLVEEQLALRSPLKTVALRLPGAEIEELKKRARRLGVGYTTYIRMLVNRHLIEEKPIGG